MDEGGTEGCRNQCCCQGSGHAIGKVIICFPKCCRNGHGVLHQRPGQYQSCFVHLPKSRLQTINCAEICRAIIADGVPHYDVMGDERPHDVNCSQWENHEKQQCHFIPLIAE